MCKIGNVMNNWFDAKTHRAPENVEIIGVLELSREKVFCFYDDLDDLYYKYTDSGRKEVKLSHWCYDESGLPK